LTAMLNKDDWELTESPAGNPQWQTKDRQSPSKDTMRLTADLALVYDDTYGALVDEWVADEAGKIKLETAFAAAWNKLMTLGTVWSSAKKCEQSTNGPQLSSVESPCPNTDSASPPLNFASVPDDATYAAALKNLDLAALKTDLTALMTQSADCSPADGGNYGGLMVRLAWHCAGTYHKLADGTEAGGCAGGRMRFEPERSWMDNAGLGNARALLGEIKQKYGDALSWGDLMTYAGTVAIQSMGGPTEPHCFGRIDEPDGQKSEVFGTTAKFEDTGCPEQGKCTDSHSGATAVGLIYVNPAGPGPLDTPNPDPAESAKEIREVFGRMGMSDSETAALIAGGHTFGQCHGGCSAPVGDTERCSNGEQFSSGFHGPWTTTPDQWSLEFLTAMAGKEKDNWELTTAPNGNKQWRHKDRTGAQKDTMRLTVDLALVYDDKYGALVDEWVADEDGKKKLETAFAAAWNKLMGLNTKWSSEKKCEATATAAVSGPPSVSGTVTTTATATAAASGPPSVAGVEPPAALNTTTMTEVVPSLAAPASLSLLVFPFILLSNR
jgi:catalase (peroxidase I)